MTCDLRRLHWTLALALTLGAVSPICGQSTVVIGFEQDQGVTELIADLFKARSKASTELKEGGFEAEVASHLPLDHFSVGLAGPVS